MFLGRQEDVNNLPEFRFFDAAAALEAAAAALSREAARPVRVSAGERLGGDERRNLILRATATSIAAGAEQAIIIKATRAVDYDATAADVFEAQGFAREWTALTLLADGGGPRLLAADRAQGVLVTADLGTLPSLVASLLRGDAAAAEAALTAYATALAGLHAATIGCRAAHAAVLRQGFPSARLRAPGEGWIGLVVRPLVDRLGGALPEAEAAAVLDRLRAPGPWQSLVHRDPCPDNVLLDADGTARLIDFEFAAPGHALLDAAYWRVGFPTCWCAGTVPEAVVDRLDAAYRKAVAAAIPAAADEDEFRRESAIIAVATLFGTLAWQLPPALAEDARWGIAGRRARILRYLSTAEAAMAGCGILPEFRALISRWEQDLRARWPAVEALAAYPAFT